jgi:transposase
MISFKHKRGRERYTLLLAISKNEIVNYDIFKGALNLEIYKKFIENNKDNFTNKTIINDNLRIHKNKTIIDYCDMNNISLSFITPYSPDFNPIENYFSEAKRIFRRYNNHELLKRI